GDALAAEARAVLEEEDARHLRPRPAPTRPSAAAVTNLARGPSETGKSLLVRAAARAVRVAAVATEVQRTIHTVTALMPRTRPARPRPSARPCRAGARRGATSSPSASGTGLRGRARTRPGRGGRGSRARRPRSAAGLGRRS